MDILSSLRVEDAHPPRARSALGVTEAGRAAEEARRRSFEVPRDADDDGGDGSELGRDGGDSGVSEVDGVAGGAGEGGGAGQAGPGEEQRGAPPPREVRRRRASVVAVDHIEAAIAHTLDRIEVLRARANEFGLPVVLAAQAVYAHAAEDASRRDDREIAAALAERFQGLASKAAAAHANLAAASRAFDAAVTILLARQRVRARRELAVICTGLDARAETIAHSARAAKDAGSAARRLARTAEAAIAGNVAALQHRSAEEARDLAERTFSALGVDLDSSPTGRELLDALDPTVAGGASDGSARRPSAADMRRLSSASLVSLASDLSEHPCDSPRPPDPEDMHDDSPPAHLASTLHALISASLSAAVALLVSHLDSAVHPALRRAGARVRAARDAAGELARAAGSLADKAGREARQLGAARMARGWSNGPGEMPQLPGKPGHRPRRSDGDGWEVPAALTGPLVIGLGDPHAPAKRAPLVIGLGDAPPQRTRTFLGSAGDGYLDGEEPRRDYNRGELGRLGTA